MNAVQQQSAATLGRMLTKATFELAANRYAAHPSASNFERLQRAALIHQHAVLNLTDAELAPLVLEPEPNEVDILANIYASQRAI